MRVTGAARSFLTGPRSTASAMVIGTPRGVVAVLTESRSTTTVPRAPGTAPLTRTS